MAEFESHLLRISQSKV